MGPTRATILLLIVGACANHHPTGTEPDAAQSGSGSPDAELPVGSCRLTQVSSPVRFSTDVYPYVNQIAICTQCHSGGGIGKDLGGLMLDAGAQKTYNELTHEISPNSGTVRVNVADPPNSMLLQLPSGASPHPVTVFHNSSDLCYQTLLQWVAAGAKFD